MELFFYCNSSVIQISNFLIAAPTIMGDYNFHRTAILLVDCKKSGELGFIINKKMQYTLDELVEEIDAPFPVYYGGPVDQDNLFFIHQLGSQIPDSIPIKEDLFWSGDFQTILKLIKSNEITPDKIRFFLGYSGWSEGQLEAEIKADSWIKIEAINPQEWMGNSCEDFWKNQMRKLGGYYLLWSNAPENPLSN